MWKLKKKKKLILPFRVKKEQEQVKGEPFYHFENRLLPPSDSEPNMVRKNLGEGEFTYKFFDDNLADIIELANKQTTITIY